MAGRASNCLTRVSNRRRTVSIRPHGGNGVELLTVVLTVVMSLNPPSWRERRRTRNRGLSVLTPCLNPPSWRERRRTRHRNQRHDHGVSIRPHGGNGVEQSGSTVIAKRGSQSALMAGTASNLLIAYPYMKEWVSIRPHGGNGVEHSTPPTHLHVRLNPPSWRERRRTKTKSYDEAYVSQSALMAGTASNLRSASIGRNKEIWGPFQDGRVSLW